jgi:hypothetical protein
MDSSPVTRRGDRVLTSQGLASPWGTAEEESHSGERDESVRGPTEMAWNRRSKLWGSNIGVVMLSGEPAEYGS